MELKVHTYIKVIPMYLYIQLVGTTIQWRRKKMMSFSEITYHETNYHIHRHTCVITNIAITITAITDP